MIFLYITYPGRKIIKVGTGEKILAKNWDFEKKVVRSATPGSLTFNTRLAYLKFEVMQAVTTATTDNPELTLSTIKQIVERVLGGKQPKFDKKNFIEYVDMFLEEKAQKCRHTTYKKYKSLKNVILGYMTSKGIQEKDFYFESIDHDFDLHFKSYLIESRKNLNNTISKAFEGLSVILKWGLRKKFHRNRSFEEFDIVPREKSDVIFLELDEVLSIEALELSDTEEVVRDIFLFALYSGGQRISDVMNLKVKDIQFGKDPTIVDWNLYQLKGKVTVKNVLPLLDKAIRALMKYYSEDSGLNSIVFPDLTEQDINLTIKDICSKAGITQYIKEVKYSGTHQVVDEGPKAEFISFHSARKSFVSIALRLGMPPELIIKYTGHTTTKIMRQHYLGISSEFKRESLFKVWQPENGL